MYDWAHLRAEVRQAIDDGWPLERVEERLPDGLAEEAAAALWLYAWSYRDRGLRSRDRPRRLPQAGDLAPWRFSGTRASTYEP